MDTLTLCILLIFAAPKEQSPERQVEPEMSEENPADFFSRESQLIRSNSQGSNMLSTKRNSSLRRSKRPGDLASSSSQSNFEGKEGIRSPEHVRVMSISGLCLCMTIPQFLDYRMLCASNWMSLLSS